MTEPDQQQLLKQISDTLEHSVTLIEPDIQQQLDDIRRKALVRQRTSETANHNEEPQLLTALAGLDDSVERLDPGIIARLEEARKSALTQADTSGSNLGIWRQLTAGFRLPQITVPISAFATACVLVTMAALYYQFPGQPTSELADADVLLFASSDDIELYDNLDFYLWLAENGLPN